MAMQARESAEEAFERFIRKALETREVWGLKSPDGWAICESLDSAGRDVIPFWSDQAGAERAAIDDWADYAATAIELARFLNLWLPDLAKRRVLTGTNWDAMNCGLEIEPEDLAEHLIVGRAKRPARP